jgi:hypothetical protein
VGVLKKGVKKRINRVVEALMAAYESPTKAFVVTEVWIWKRQILREAEKRPGWKAGTAISVETGFDLRTEKGQRDAWKVLESESPDLVVLAFPCGPWSVLQNMQKTKNLVKEKQDADRVFLCFAAKVAKWQQDRDRFFMIENPAASQVWKQEELKALVDEFGVVTMDMCAMGLEDPYTQQPLRKKTGILTNALELQKSMREVKCRCEKPHKPILGHSWEQQEDESWKSVSLPTFAGGYTVKFAQTVLQAVETELVSLTCPVDVFGRQRQLHEHMEAFPFLRGSKAPRIEEIAEDVVPTRPTTRKQWLKRAAAKLARRQKVLRAVSMVPEPPRSFAPAPTVVETLPVPEGEPQVFHRQPPRA